jgi:ATP-dependent DNA ligase
MASSKRNMSDFNNYDVFPYQIKNGIIHYGPIYNIQMKNKIRSWKIEISLHDGSDENNIKITKKLIDNIDKDNNYYVLIYKITNYLDKDSAIQNILSDKIMCGKNIGKKNETNILQQSLIVGRGYYLKKVNAGFSLDLELIQNQLESKQSNKSSKNNYLPFPMAVNSYKDHKNKISYPCYIQPKLDGIRAVIYKDKETNKLKMISRRHKHILGFENLLSELENNKIFDINHNPDCYNTYLDGELYNHSLTLQKISGIVRKENNEDKNKLKFYMFDIFNINKADLYFEERIDLINLYFNDLEYLTIVESIKIFNEEEGDKYLDEYIQKKYEGIIYKPIDKPYEFSFNKEIRSNFYLKRKLFFDNEFKIIGYELDKNGCIIFILITEDEIEFKSTPKLTIKERKNFIKENNFKKDYLNKFATIRYDDLSDDGVPVRSRFIGLRNYE